MSVAALQPAAKTAFKWMPVIETDACMGCGLCAKACEPGCIEMIWDFATLVRPDHCTSCGECMNACPHGVIRMDWVSHTGNVTLGSWTETPPAPEKPKHWLRGWVDRLAGSGKTEPAAEGCPR